MKHSLALRFNGLALLVLAGPSSLWGQSVPSKEYIRLGDRVVAIENNPSAGGGGLIFGTPSTGQNVGAASVSGTVSVISNISGAWSVSSDMNWFHLTGTTTGTGQGTTPIAYTIDANPGTAPRNATLTLNGISPPPTLTFGQAGSSGGGLTLTPSAVTLTSTPQSASVTVTSVANWTATSNAAWLTVTTPSGATGTSQLGFSVTANSSGPARQGTITVTGGGYSQALTVTQNQIISFSIGPPNSYVTYGSSIQLDAVVNSVVLLPSERSLVTWSVVSGGGSISSTGLYTAPNVTVDATVSGTYQGLNWPITIHVVAALGYAQVDSIIPNTGTGNNATFSLTAHDPNSLANLQYVDLHFGAFDYPVFNNCAIKTGIAGSQAYVNLESQGPLLFPPAQQPTAIGTRCDVTLAQATTSRNTTINQFSVSLPIAFKSTGTSGSQGIWVQAVDLNNLQMPSTQVGTFTITGAPTVGPLSPTTGSGASQTFTATYSYDQNIATSLNSAELLVNASTSTVGACYVKYDKVLNLFYLRNDAGTAWLGGIAPGSASTIQNSQCTFSGTGSTASWSFNSLTLNVPLTFVMNTFVGAKLVYLRDTDTGNVTSSLEPLGSYTVNVAPAVTVVAPASGAGMSQTFNATVSDQNGSGDIKQIRITFAGGTGSCDVLYSRIWQVSGALFEGISLINNSGQFQNPVALGSNNVLSNSYCSINAAQSIVGSSGNDVTLTVPVTFTAAYSGVKTFSVTTTDSAASSATWSSGSWNVAQATAITLASLPSGVPLSVDGGSTCVTPCSFQWVTGSSHTITSATTQSGGSGVQYVWVNWSDSGAASHAITVPVAATTYTATFTTQYYLTTMASPSVGGSITPASGWYNSGTVVALTATPSALYTFTGFSGSVSGGTPQNITMSGTKSVTANFMGVATPTFTPGGGSYSTTQSVTVSTVTAGAAIRYTLDGSTPTSTTGTLYSTAISISSTKTLKAIAYKSGLADSDVATATYTFGPPWYNAGWTNRKAITVDHTKVSGAANLTNFPVLVSVTDATLKTVANGGNVGKSDGTDILLTAADGVTKLNHEIEGYDAATGSLTAWIKIPSLSPTVDTVVYAYYGNASAADQQNKTGVWDSNYKGVWHLGSNSTLSSTDSTSSGNNGTVFNAPTGVAAKIGTGADFNGTNSYMTTPGVGFSSGTATATLEGWVKVNGNGSYSNNMVFGYGTNTSYMQAFMVNYDYTNGKWWMNGGLGAIEQQPVATFGQWQHIVIEITGNNTNAMYLNGTLVAAQANLYGDSWNIPASPTFRLAYDPASGYGKVSLDEVRVSNVSRSADWILTEYRNQNAPGTFLALGALESPGPMPPAAPTNLTASAGNSQVALSWTASSGASSYTVLRGTVSGGPYGTTVASGITGTSTTDTTVTNGTTYYYVVAAVNGNGTSGNSNQVSATPSSTVNGSTLVGSVTTNLLNNATCPGQTFTATITMQNTGTRVWTTANQHQLVSLDSIWGTNTLALPSSPINPGASAVFSLTVTAPATAGSYTFRWQMKQGDTSELFGSITSVPITVQGALPAGWSQQDIGAVIQPGCASYNGSGTYQVYGAGHLDAWNVNDTFRFAYQPLTGNGSIIARIVSTNHAATGPYSYAGVMMRDGLGTAISRYVFAGRRMDTNANIKQYRPDNLDLYSGASFLGSGIPTWVKLTRFNNVFTAYESTDGVNWSQYTTSTVTTMGSTIYVGLVAVSTDGTAATFDNVTIGP